jgi:hypothetical protein
MDQSSWGYLLVIAVAIMAAVIGWDRLRSRGRADRRREKRESAAHYSRLGRSE